jgi:hypothetical protein
MSQLEVQAARGELAKCERWARAVLADCELIRYTTADEVIGAISVLLGEIESLRSEVASARVTVCHDCVVALEVDPILCESCESRRNAEGMDLSHAYPVHAHHKTDRE